MSGKAVDALLHSGSWMTILRAAIPLMVVWFCSGLY